jgi:hypothetical protein
MSQHQEENEALAHLFHMDIFQEGKLELADEIIASDFVWRNPIIASELQCGPKSIKKLHLLLSRQCQTVKSRMTIPSPNATR